MVENSHSENFRPKNEEFSILHFWGTIYFFLGFSQKISEFSGKRWPDCLPSFSRELHFGGALDKSDFFVTFICGAIFGLFVQGDPKNLTKVRFLGLPKMPKWPNWLAP